MRGSHVLAQTLGGLVRELVPPWLLPAFVVLTELGNVGTFLVLFTLDYWFGDRERGAHAIALVIGGMAVITALKYFFAVPRPPEPVNVIPISGFSFPSGHATGATIAYGTLAFDLDAGSRRVRYAAAAAIVGLVALSRVVLGVHFVRDVVAGVGFGVAFLAVAFALTGHSPRRGFALAVALAVVALVVSAASRDGVAVLGAAVGAAAVWETTGAGQTVEDRRWRAVLVAVVLPVLAALGYLSVAAEIPLAVAFVATVALFAAMIGVPAAVKHLRAADVRRSAGTP